MRRYNFVGRKKELPDATKKKNYQVNGGVGAMQYRKLENTTTKRKRMRKTFGKGIKGKKTERKRRGA